MSAQGGWWQCPLQDRAKAIYWETWFLKIKWIFALVCSQKRGGGQVHRDTNFPRDGEEISWKTRRVSGEGETTTTTKKTHYFHSMAMTFRAGKCSKRDINGGNQSLITGPASPKAAKCLVPTSVPRDSFGHILFLGLGQTAPNRLPCQARAARKLHFWSCY